MVWWVCVALAAVAAEPVTVFDDDPTPGDGGYEGARIVVGGDDLSRVPAAELTGYVELGARGGLPVIAESPFSGREALRLTVLGSARWWQLDLTCPLGIPLDRSETAAGRLILALRSDAADGLEVGLIDAGVPRRAVRVPLIRYGRVERTWTVYRIPIADLVALEPNLALDRLAAVVLFSARPGPLRLDIDAVRIEPGRSVSPTREVPAPAPSEPLTSPTPPTPPTDAAPPAAAPERPAARTTAPEPAGNAARPSAAEPREVRGEPKPPHSRPPVAQPKPPEEPPSPHSLPDATPQAPPAPAGPQPDAPARPARTEVPQELRPMLPVSTFFLEAPIGETRYAPSRWAAGFATNQGERPFETDELKDYFGVAGDDQLPIVTIDEPGRSGPVLKLHVKQAGFAWWTVSIGRYDGSSSDESAHLRNGRLEFAIRGERGDETLRIGLEDGTEPPHAALVPLETYARVTTDWQLVRVPLRALKAAEPGLDWTKVRAVRVASANGLPMTVYLDDLRIVIPPSEE